VQCTGAVRASPVAKLRGLVGGFFFQSTSVSQSFLKLVEILTDSTPAEVLCAERGAERSESHWVLIFFLCQKLLLSRVLLLLLPLVGRRLAKLHV